MDNQLLMMQGLSMGEISTLQDLMKTMGDSEKQNFLALYRTKRREPQMILVLAIVGFFGVAGVQRFVLGQIGMGILYLFTGGLCAIGTIIDIVNYEKMATEYNQKIAYESLQMMQIMGKTFPDTVK